MSKTKKPAPAPAAAPEPKHESMRIYEFHVENIKKIVVVDGNPHAGLNVIAGDNGSGKTSLLDALWYGIAGVGNLPPQPIRTGAERGLIKIDIGPYVVTRDMPASGTTKGGTLKVYNKAAKAFMPEAQTFLRSFLSYISIDPLEFKRMDARKQFDTLKKLTPGVDIEKLDAEIKESYDARRVADRERQALTPRIDAIKVPAGLPVEMVDEVALITQLSQAGTTERSRQLLIAQKKHLAEDAANDRASATRDRAEALDLRRQADELDKGADAADEGASVMEGKAEAIEIPDTIDTAALEEEFSAARTTNAGIATRKQREELEKEQREKAADVERLDAEVDARRKAREEAIAQAKMPIAGLGYGEGMVLYEGLPFEQANDAKQIEVSVALAMSTNPTLRFMLIRDGSLLDKKSMAAIAKMATENDYQIFMERVDTGGEEGIVLEGGEVVAVKRGKKTK